MAPCGVRVELADVFRQLVEVFDGHPRCSSKVCWMGGFLSLTGKSSVVKAGEVWVVALRFFRCIRVLGHGTLLCSAVVRLSVVSLALALASAHKHV